MTRSFLSRAVATATAACGAFVLACLCPSGYALQGGFASAASAFTPTSTSTTGGGGESTPLDLKAPSSAVPSTSGGGASIVRTIVGLAIVIAVIWGLAWIMRQVKSGRGGSGSAQPSAGLASVAALTLGSGRSVHLVRAGSDYVLLGSTEHGVAPIHRYTEEQARDAGLLGEPDDAAPERSRLASAASHITTQLFVARSTPEHTPVVGHRPDPMRMPSPPAGLVGRLREMTVRR
jgi:flagellar protein FliO/FliZ